MTTPAAWLTMGGYAAYVWPAYGIAMTVLGGLTLHFWRRYRQSSDELTCLQRQVDRAG
jgi:heme exporter protein D